MIAHVHVALISAINAQVSITTVPEVPSLDDDLTLTCQVETEVLLRPSGTLFLQLENGSIITVMIQSPIATLMFEFTPFTSQDVGKYYCNVSITSPEFPGTGLRAFKGIDLQDSCMYLAISCPLN